MQSKLNEILELCIEKTNEKKFYEFKFRSDIKVLIITHFDIDARKIISKMAFNEDILYQALEYMQNE